MALSGHNRPCGQQLLFMAGKLVTFGSSWVFGPPWRRRRQDGWTSTPKAAGWRLLKQRPKVRIESIDPHGPRRLQRSLARDPIPTGSASGSRSSEIARDGGKRSLADFCRSWSGRDKESLEVPAPPRARTRDCVYRLSNVSALSCDTLHRSRSCDQHCGLWRRDPAATSLSRTSAEGGLTLTRGLSRPLAKAAGLTVTSGLSNRLFFALVQRDNVCDSGSAPPRPPSHSEGVAREISTVPFGEGTSDRGSGLTRTSAHCSGAVDFWKSSPKGLLFGFPEPSLAAGKSTGPALRQRPKNWESSRT